MAKKKPRYRLAFSTDKPAWEQRFDELNINVGNIFKPNREFWNVIVMKEFIENELAALRRKTLEECYHSGGCEDKTSVEYIEEELAKLD